MAMAARERVRMLFVFGLILTVIFSAFATYLWPSTEFVPDYLGGGSKQDTGNLQGALLCVGAAAIGQIMMLIAVVAWGVRLGVESADRSPAELSQPHPKGGGTASA